MSDDVLARLREAAHNTQRGGREDSFSPEQVARGLERMREVGKYNGEESWAAMLDAFLAAARHA